MDLVIVDGVLLSCFGVLGDISLPSGLATIVDAFACGRFGGGANPKLLRFEIWLGPTNLDVDTVGTASWLAVSDIWCCRGLRRDESMYDDAPNRSEAAGRITLYAMNNRN